MLAQRLQAKPEPHEDPLLCGRLLHTGAIIRHTLTEIHVQMEVVLIQSHCPHNHGKLKFSRSCTSMILYQINCCFTVYQELFVPLTEIHVQMEVVLTVRIIMES